MTTFSGPLNVKPWLVEPRTTYIEGSGTTVIHEDLHVSATAIFYDQVDFRDGVLIDTLLAQVVNTSGLNVSATTRFGSQTSFAGEILVSGSAFFYEGARFSASTRFLGPVSFSSGIISSGNGTFAENVSVSAKLFLNDLDVSGSAVIHGVMSVSGSTEIHGNLNVSGTSIFQHRVIINGPESNPSQSFGLEVFASSLFRGVAEFLATARFTVSGGGAPIIFDIRYLTGAAGGAIGGSSSALTTFTAVPYTSEVSAGGTPWWTDNARIGLRYEGNKSGTLYHAGMDWRLANNYDEPVIGIFGKSDNAGTSLYFGTSNYLALQEGLDVLFKMDHFGDLTVPGGISVGAPMAVGEIPAGNSADTIYSSSVFYGPVTFLGGISVSGSGGSSSPTTLDVSGSSRLRGEVDVSATASFYKQIKLPRDTLALGVITGNVSAAAMLIGTPFTALAQQPGITWSNTDSTPDLPRAAIYTTLIADATYPNGGSFIDFAVSNNWSSGITNVAYVDPDGNFVTLGKVNASAANFTGRVLLAGGATVSASSVFHANTVWTSGAAINADASARFTYNVDVSATAGFRGPVLIGGGSAVISQYATIISNNTAGNPVSFTVLPNSSLIEAYIDTVVPWSDLTGTRIKLGVSGSAMFFSNVAVSGTTATGIRQRASDSRTGTLKRWNRFSSMSGDATGTIKVFASAFLGTTTGETVVTINYVNA